MKAPRIGLFGYSRTGKDTFARVLVSEFSALQVSQGLLIKQEFADLIALKENVFEFVDARKHWLDTEMFWPTYFEYGAEVIDFCREHYQATGDFIDAFTEVDHLKNRLRPLLEHGGYVVLGHVEEKLQKQIQDYPGLVINSRLFDVPQCQAWREQGGLIVEIHRPGAGPLTDYEAQHVAAVREAGLINVDLHNSGTQGEWEQLARDFAVQVMTQSLNLSA